MTHPRPDRPLHLGLGAAELEGKPYARFWRPAMAPLAAHVREALLVGPVAEPLLPRLEDVAGMLEGGDGPLEDGFGFARDGAAVIACRTAMPGCAPSMVDWWFGWHGAEPQRYKLWHPRAHVHAAWDAPDAPGSTGRARYVGRTSFVDEYVGSRMNHVTIRFVRPVELGLDEARLDPEVATAVCARIGFAAAPVDLGWLVHHVRRVPGGAEMRSRFWLGGRHAGVRAGVLGPAASWVARKVKRATLADCAALLVHCAQEMSHLAGFLPALHPELG